jgi:hypothetical protein
MPNPVERWLLKRTARPSVEATTSLLHRLLPHCAACQGGLACHTYRFFSTHPADDTAAANSFRAAVEAGNWAAVHLAQAPAINQPIYVVYVIACPQSGGMVAMLLADPSGSDTLPLSRAVSAGELAHIRTLCPTCEWISFDYPAL